MHPSNADSVFRVRSGHIYAKLESTPLAGKGLRDHQNSNLNRTFHIGVRLLVTTREEKHKKYYNHAKVNLIGF